MQHMRQIVCDNPTVILHPLAAEFLSRFRVYVMFGRRFECLSHEVYFEKYLSRLSPKLQHVTRDNMDECYFLDESTGECVPMYLLVRCGHCENCQKSKVSSFVHRCKLESMSYNCEPIFLTLTYNENFKPKDGVCLRHVQLFFKRLRINLQRHGFTDKIRYVCVSEYGKNTHRPHYHAILWNLRQTDILSYQQIGEIIEKSWQLGFEMHRLINLRDDKAFFYTSKYLSKGCNVPDGQNKTFMVCSNRSGGIGALFLDTLKPELRKTLNTRPKFFNKFTGEVEDLQLSRYVLNRLFPSPSSILTSKVRSAVKRFVFNYHCLRVCDEFKSFHANLAQFDRSFCDVVDFFSKYMYIFEPRISSVKNFYSSPDLICALLRDLNIIENFFVHRRVYFEDEFKFSHLRKLYLDKYFRVHTDVVDLAKRRSEFVRKKNYLLQFEVL